MPLKEANSQLVKLQYNNVYSFVICVASVNGLVQGEQ